MGSSFDRLRRRLDAAPLAPLAAVGVAAGSAVGAAVLWAPSGARVVVAAGLAGLSVPLAWSARTAVEVVPEKQLAVQPPTLLELVAIQEGAFLMGSKEGDPRADPDEHPQHRVEVEAFLLGKYLVTQEEYEAVTGANPSTHKGRRKPVTDVSWRDAVKFCNLLSQRAGLAPAYDIAGDKVSWHEGSDGYRLPTEEEWEYAARAGTQTTWSFGDNENAISKYAWFSENSGGEPHPVGEKMPNRCGLFDMHGNVWEWCWNEFYPYSEPSRVDDARVLRGGAFVFDAWHLRSAYRRRSQPERRFGDVGFRCARGLRRSSRSRIYDH